MILLSKLKLGLVFITLLAIVLKFCCPKEENIIISSNLLQGKALAKQMPSISFQIDQNVNVKRYFTYIDSIIKKYDSLMPYTLTEHVLVRSNPWIIDTLQNTDYYRMKARDSFVYNQKEMIVLPMGSVIKIPDPARVIELLNAIKNTHLDINIPEFKLRIYEDSKKLYEFPIRVGRNEKKYLKMAGRVVDLKTRQGRGLVVNHVIDPSYYNPANGHRYFVTKRDDKKITKLPQIPFIETEINGVRNGQLIHPTTNPITLERAYSNGCIGTKESDAWVIYYYAPIGTKINIRYDLNATDEKGERVVLKDIYGFNK